MKTFAMVAAVLYGIFGIWFLYVLLSSKPKWHKGNRMVGNWKEGGKILFWLWFVVLLIVSLAATGIILTFNFLER